jgi:hypothetical protein
VVVTALREHPRAARGAAEARDQPARAETAITVEPLVRQQEAPAMLLVAETAVEAVMTEPIQRVLMEARLAAVAAVDMPALRMARPTATALTERCCCLGQTRLRNSFLALFSNPYENH